MPLQTVFLHVTKACNLHCTYCYFSARRPLPDEMTSEEYCRLWPELVAAGPAKLVFTGGEPLLRDDILELIRGLRDADPEHRVRRCLNSNGLLVTPRLAQQLVGLADEVRLSLDAFARYNDALRGMGSFDAVLRALETYRAVGFVPKVLVTVTRQSLPDLEELLCFLLERGCAAVNVNRFRPVGRGAAHPELAVAEAEVQRAVTGAVSRLGHHPRPSGEPTDDDTQGHCGVGRFLNVMPNGDVFPCHVLTWPEFRCGNVREQGLLEICRRQGLLGALSGLDFHQLARTDNALSSLVRRGACLGEVYAGTPKSEAWKALIR